MLQRRKRECERGSALIEFVLSALVWVPLLLGTVVFSVNLIRAIQVSQLARDSGHMYAQGVDFAQAQNAALLTRLASGLGIQQKSGEGAVLLSKITLVTQQDCDAANIQACSNLGKYVFTSLYVFGDGNYAKSKLGSPDDSDYAKGTALQPQDYLVKSSLVAPNFPHLFDPPSGQPAQAGQYAFVSEVSVNSQVISWSDFSNTGSYARSIF
jgi:hypothetical protein